MRTGNSHEPMDHRQLISSLSPEERIRLTARSNLKGLTHLALHWGAIAVTGALIGARVPLWPLLLPVQGILLIFLFTLFRRKAALGRRS